MHTQSQNSAALDKAASVGRFRLLKFLCFTLLPASLALTSIEASATDICEPFEKQVSFDGGLTWFDADDPNMPAQGFTGDSLYRFLLENCEPNKVCLNTSVSDDTLEIFDVLVDVDGPGGYAPGFIPTCSQDPVFCQVTVTDEHPGFENLNQPDICIPENTATETTFVQGSTNPEIMTDPAYVACPPDIDIEKATNGVDADDPNAGDAPQIEPGDPVSWTYKVTNTGSVTLFNVMVTDDQAVAVTCPTDRLGPGGMMTCTANGFADDLFNTGFTTVPGMCGSVPDWPLYENKGRATGETALGDFVMDEDPSHYCNPPGPDIDIEKATNGVDADDPNAGDAPQIAPGDPVTWSYLVTNTGAVPLANLTVFDDQIGAINCPQSTLAVDESIICTAMGTAEDVEDTLFTTVPGTCGSTPNRPLYENMGTATGTYLATGEMVMDVDPSHYCNPEEPAIDIEKATNGVDADDPNAGDAPQIDAGDTVTWSYVVTNTGTVPLINVMAFDDTLGVTLTCPQNALAPMESMVCDSISMPAMQLEFDNPDVVEGTCGNEPGEPLYENISRVMAESESGTPVQDQDPSHYCNPPPPPDCGLTVLKGCEVLPPPPPAPGKCAGRLTQLTMIWDGTSGTSVNGPGFNGTVNNGDEVVFQGPFSDNDVKSLRLARFGRRLRWGGWLGWMAILVVIVTAIRPWPDSL